MLPRRRPSSTPSRNPSSDLSHVGRADAPKKVRICRVTERLPRIARLPHLKTQTPRTPKKPRTPRAKSSTTTAENKRVGRRWSSPGGLQSAAHRRCAKRAGHSATSLSDTSRSITKGESERPSSLCKPRLLFPSLFLFPGGWGLPESRSKKKRNFRTWRLLGSIFDPSRTRFENDFQKTSKKL